MSILPELMQILQQCTQGGTISLTINYNMPPNPAAGGSMVSIPPSAAVAVKDSKPPAKPRVRKPPAKKTNGVTSQPPSASSIAFTAASDTKPSPVRNNKPVEEVYVPDTDDEKTEAIGTSAPAGMQSKDDNVDFFAKLKQQYASASGSNATHKKSVDTATKKTLVSDSDDDVPDAVVEKNNNKTIATPTKSSKDTSAPTQPIASSKSSKKAIPKRKAPSSTPGLSSPHKKANKGHKTAASTSQADSDDCDSSDSDYGSVVEEEEEEEQDDK